MGIKGNKASTEGELSAAFLLEKLVAISGITSKKMFGGHGIFCDGKMFGIVDSKGMIFFKVDESNQQQFIDQGGLQHYKMPYYSVPQNILDDQDTLVKWAKLSITVANK